MRIPVSRSCLHRQGHAVHCPQVDIFQVAQRAEFALTSINTHATNLKSAPGTDRAFPELSWPSWIFLAGCCPPGGGGFRPYMNNIAAGDGAQPAFTAGSRGYAVRRQLKVHELRVSCVVEPDATVGLKPRVASGCESRKDSLFYQRHRRKLKWKNKRISINTLGCSLGRPNH